MARKTTSKPVPAAHVSFSTWKAAAVQALAQVNGRAILTTRDGFWTRLYVRGLSPEDAAQAAAREYASTHRPDLATQRRINR